MKRLAYCAVPGLLVAVVATAAVKTLTIEPAMTRVDGSPLALGDIARHQIECRRDGGEWSIALELDMPALTADHDFAAGSWECRGYTVDTHGQRSDPGDVVPFVVTPARPHPPVIEIH